MLPLLPILENKITMHFYFSSINNKESIINNSSTIPVNHFNISTFQWISMIKQRIHLVTETHQNPENKHVVHVTWQNHHCCQAVYVKTQKMGSEHLHRLAGLQSHPPTFRKILETRKIHKIGRNKKTHMHPIHYAIT